MDIIDLIIYITTFISGTVFGSFFTLAVHRIPKHQDITHERSYCPNCNHKLGFLDLIPVWSYIFLGGKCRYCKNKIRPRYLILEICSGLVLLSLCLTYKINYESTFSEVSMFAISILFICAMFIIAGIDREYYIIPNSVLIYGLFISVALLVLKYYTNVGIIPNIIGFLVIPFLLIAVRLLFTKLLNFEEFPIGEGDIKYLAVLGLFFGVGLQIAGIIISMFATLIGLLIDKFIFKKDISKIPFGLYLSIGFTIVMILSPYLNVFIETCNGIFNL